VHFDGLTLVLLHPGNNLNIYTQKVMGEKDQIHRGI